MRCAEGRRSPPRCPPPRGSASSAPKSPCSERAVNVKARASPARSHSSPRPADGRKFPRTFQLLQKHCCGPSWYSMGAAALWVGSWRVPGSRRIGGDLREDLFGSRVVWVGRRTWHAQAPFFTSESLRTAFPLFCLPQPHALPRDPMLRVGSVSRCQWSPHVPGPRPGPSRCRPTRTAGGPRPTARGPSGLRSWDSERGRLGLLLTRH